MQDLGKLVTGERRHDDMHVVGHDNPLAQQVARVLKVNQRLCHDLSDIGTTQHAFSISRIEPFVKAVDELLFVFALLDR